MQQLVRDNSKKGKISIQNEKSSPNCRQLRILIRKKYQKTIPATEAREISDHLIK